MSGNQINDVNTSLKNFSTQELAAEIEARSKLAVRGPYTNPVATWTVTTEGDCEGKTVIQLGNHKGHLVDIARALSGLAYYELRFSLAREQTPPALPIPRDGVTVSLDIDSGLWDLPKEERARALSHFLKKEKPKTKFAVSLKEGSTYAGSFIQFLPE